MSSKLSIYKMTLRRLNCESISALSSGTKREGVLDDFYDEVVLMSLAAFPWSFATKEVSYTSVTNLLYYEALSDHTSGDFQTDLAAGKWSVIAEDTTLSAWVTATAYVTGNKILAPNVRWTRKLALPSDYVKLIREYNGSKVVRQGAFLYTDETTLDLIYTWNNVTETNFTPDFVNYLYLRLAQEACYALTQDKKLKEEISLELEDVLDSAKSRVSQESTPEDFEIDDFLNARL